MFDGNQVFSDGTLRGQDEEGQGARLLQPLLAGGQDHLHRGQVAGGRGGPAGRPRAARGPLPQPRVRHGPDRAAEDHLHGRQARRLQEEAGQADEARDPGERGRAVPDGGAEVRGSHRAQGGVRPDVLQDEAGGRLQRREVQEGVREAAGRVREPRLLPVDGGHAEEARPGEEGRGHHGEDGGGQAVLRRAHQLHRERLDAGQGDPARDLHERGGGVQHRGPQDVDQADQPARLLQADGGGAGHPAERARGEQGGRDVQGGGAEPEPVHLRRRGLRATRGRS